MSGNLDREKGKATFREPHPAKPQFAASHNRKRTILKGRSLYVSLYKQTFWCIQVVLQATKGANTVNQKSRKLFTTIQKFGITCHINNFSYFIQ